MTSHAGFADREQPKQEIPPQSVTTGAINGAGVDMQGWEGVAFLIEVGVITGLGAVDGRAEQADDSGFTTNKVNVTSAAIVQVLAANNNTLQVLDVYRPTQRFVRCVATQSVNTTVFGVTSVRYRRTGLLPATKDASQIVKVAAN